MAEYTSNYNLEKPAETEFYDVAVQNGNMDKIDEAIASIDTAKADAKSTLADGDAVSIVDSADSSKTKRVLWSTFKSALGQLFVPLTRKINNKELSSDLNLTSEDIPTSDTDETSISSQLSKALKGYRHDNSMSLLDTYLPDGLHMCNNWDDVPAGQIDSQGNCLSITYLHYADLGQYWGRRIYFPANDGNAIYVNVCSAGVWQGWERIGTATPPQEFDLLLAEGFSAAQPCTYWKNQFGAVTIGGTAEKSNGVADLTTIATLPESFRPAKNVERPAILSGGGSRYAGSVLIGSNGSVRIHTPTTANVVTFAATFLAAD